MKVKVLWQVCDGYVGGSRPQHTEFDTGDYMDDEEWNALGEEKRQKIIEDNVREDFNQKVDFSIDSITIE